MDGDRIKNIQLTTGTSSSLSVYRALLQVWTECAQDSIPKSDLRKLVEWLREEQADCQLTMPTMATAYRNVADRIDQLLGGE